MGSVIVEIFDGDKVRERAEVPASRHVDPLNGPQEAPEIIVRGCAAYKRDIFRDRWDRPNSTVAPFRVYAYVPAIAAFLPER